LVNCFNVLQLKGRKIQFLFLGLISVVVGSTARKENKSRHLCQLVEIKKI
jgi:hypothetical protein